MMTKKKDSTTTEDIEGVDDVVTDDDDCIGYGDSFPEGKTIANFSFPPPDSNQSVDVPTPITQLPAAEATKDTPEYKTYPNGITPPIDGEFFTIKRSYLLRASTVRKINQLAACHPNFNVYYSSIVDKAINHYYDYIFNEGGSQ